MSNKQALPLDLRYAIYLAHKRRCVYTGDLLCSFSEVTIEHIIREGTPDEYFAQKKKDYGLDDSFNLNSLENLLPVKRLPYQTDREKIKTGELWTAKQSYIWLEKVLETIKVTQISTCENEHVNKSRSLSYYINIIKRMWGNEK